MEIKPFKINNMNIKIVNIINCRLIPSNIFIAFAIKENAKIIKMIDDE